MMSALVRGLAPLARVTIPEATFALGSTRFPDSQPVTDVTVSAFDISETKATVGDYDVYLRAIGKNRITLAVTDPGTGEVSLVGRGRTESEVLRAYERSLSTQMSPGARIELGSWMVFEVTTPKIPPKFRKHVDQPVNCIDWWEMLAFAAAHGGDLPTEVECERVIRGKSGKDEYGTVSGTSLRWDDGSKLAQFGTDVTSRVKIYPANSLGVFDASGNVFNWTKTWYVPSYEGLGNKDPRGPRQGEYKVLRGGSCDFGGDRLHAAYRLSYLPPIARSKIIGGVVVWRSRQ